MASISKAVYPGSPLHVGSKGDAVRALQAELNTYGNHLTVDGVYGPETAKVVEAYERNRHLGTDGGVDWVIWASIFREPAPRLHPRRPMTQADHLRALREEIPVRQRQLKAGGDPKRLQAIRLRLQAVEAAVVKLVAAKSAPVQVIGNTAIGGTPRERLRALALAAHALDQDGSRIHRYSENGSWTVAYPVTGTPAPHRDDCSEWVTALYHAAGLADPNGASFTGGYTGTLAAHGVRVSAAEADWGDAVIWDPTGPQGHVAMHMAKGSGQCIGHGSPGIDIHPISVFAYKGEPIYVRYV